MVAGKNGARSAADPLGRGCERVCIERDHRRADEGRAHRRGHQWRPPEWRCAQSDRDSRQKGRAVYSTPFLAHATMEPMNATVRVSANKAEAWVPTQNA